MLIANSVQSEDLSASREQCEALVRRVAASKVFQKTLKLQEFLLYICECRLRHGDNSEVKEQQIGINVYNRCPGYNMSGDSVVRVQARELRKKLALYFETEGKDEPIRIEISKGGYLPDFILVSQEDKDKPLDPGEQPQGSREEVVPVTAGYFQQNSKKKTIVLVLLALGAVLLFVAGWFMGARRGSSFPGALAQADSRQAYSFYNQLLGPIGSKGRESLLVMSNPQLIYFRNMNSLTASEVSAHHMVPVSQQLQKTLQQTANLNLLGDPNQTAYFSVTNADFTGMGEAACVFNIEKVMSALDRSVRLTQGRFLTWDVATQNNLIVLGNPILNLWTRDNLMGRNFRISDGGVRNASPLPGEQPLYKSIFDSSDHPVEDYGVISMSTAKSGSKILILAGHTSAGTYGSGTFFGDPVKMRPAYDQIVASRAGKHFPQNWEILVRVSIRDGIPVDTALVATRSNDPN
jgi:hypothetical protein